MDHAGALADADIFPFLIKLATQGKMGLSVDIGASLGNCAHPILSLGHQVHLFEGQLADEGSGANWQIKMTLQAPNVLKNDILQSGKSRIFGASSGRARNQVDDKSH